MMFVAICVVFLAVCHSSLAFYQVIETGYVGITFTFGKMGTNLAQPGLHFFIPMMQRMEKVELRAQKDALRRVDCVTQEALHLTFDIVEVGNQLKETHVYNTTSRFGTDYDGPLVKDLVRHQINVICSKKTAHQIAIEDFELLDDLLMQFIQNENDRQNSGLIINFVRLTKPELPKSIQENYLRLAEEKTEKKVLIERSEKLKTQKESEMMVASMNNEIDLSNAQNANRIKVVNMENANQISLLEEKNKLELMRLQNQVTVEAAEANAKKAALEAEITKSLHSIDGYVSLKMAEAISQNQKIYYGNALPDHYPLLSLGTSTGVGVGAAITDDRLGNTCTSNDPKKCGISHK